MDQYEVSAERVIEQLQQHIAALSLENAMLKARLAENNDPKIIDGIDIPIENLEQLIESQEGATES